MDSCGCNLPQGKKDKLRYKQIAGRLPLLKGSIIRPDGTVIDIADIIGVSKSPIDPQLARAQNLFPYIRDTVLLEDGQTCSLTQMVERFLLYFEQMEQMDEKWTKYLDALRLMLKELEEYVKFVEEQAGLVYTEELRLTYYSPVEGDWIDGDKSNR